MALIEWHEDHAGVFRQLCQSLRQVARLPIVALCRGGRDACVAAIVAGADDALRLPLHLPYLKARHVAWLRARNGITRSLPLPSTPDEGVLVAGPLRLDLAVQQLATDGKVVGLTEREADLMAYLMQHPGELVSRHDLLRHVWHLEFDPSTNTVDVYVYYLRKKLKRLGLKGLIETKRGRGYRFVPPS